MPKSNESFEDFLHPLVHKLMDKNERFNKQYGKHKRWDWDDEAVTLTFSDPVKPTLRIDVAVVGTTKGARWQWTWANRNFKSRSRLGIEKVREFGEARGYEKLTTAFIDADEYTGREMAAVAAHILNAPGAYRFATDEGFCYLVYRKIEEIPNSLKGLHGAMRGIGTIPDGVDITGVFSEMV
jgi:hypothetical protein